MLFHSGGYGTWYSLLGRFWLILLSYFCIICVNYVHCDAPEDPIKCSFGNSDCVITNIYGSFPDRSTCRAADAVYPENEQQLISYIRDATIAERKIKVVTKYSHSFPKLVCPDGQDGLIISTKNLNKVIYVNMTEETITVESGMMLRQLIDEAAKVNLALPNTPCWEGLTVGGMLGTGAHGSSLWGRGSAVHDYVVRLKIVSPGEHEDDYAKVRTLTIIDEDLDAAKVSLGVLGVISQVTLKLEPMFKRNITYITKDDTELGFQASTFGLQHEFADIVWLPSQHQAIYRIDNRVSSAIPGNGTYDFIGFRSTPRVVSESSRKTEELQESNGYSEWRCLTSEKATRNFVQNAFGLTNDGISFTGYPVIGFQNKIQSSEGCLDIQNNFAGCYCGWDPRINGLFLFSNAFFLPMSNVTSFIEDIRKLVDMDPMSLCGLELYVGILMRYVKASSAYLGKDDDGIDFDITYYRSRDALGPRLNGDIIDEIEQMTIFKYGGVPHWGKNRNIAFEGVIKKYKDGQKFLRVKESYDPLRLFSSEWTDQILGLNEGLSKNKIGCAPEGLCICYRDDDCGPGYNCRFGRVYAEAKVCKKKKSKLISDN